ncbi:hypothetical protein VCRA2126O85_570002 [Vibrio crassostreae]|nr:hypothetical protein VCRA2125O83_40268 [Vibrio crassostreae]CAK3018091.1 hypothetical protein VCRA2126O86_560002 [Vibrio crassostreae]CAK3019257.1 hypothetical protein VCRA2128O106_580002 [Vibrio crassostreae]CAK3021878.1 hypothetical protein VCRA2127O91_560011 [Vibrio crassostreae]CAK3022045.1 hypothetical protein VCRA2126O85_570002 [Vibrio crassostreae]
MYGKPTMSKSIAHPCRTLGLQQTAQHNPADNTQLACKRKVVMSLFSKVKMSL